MFADDHETSGYGGASVSGYVEEGGDEHDGGTGYGGEGGDHGGGGYGSHYREDD